MGGAVSAVFKAVRRIVPIFTSVVRLCSSITPIGFLANTAVLAVQVFKPKAVPFVAIVMSVATGDMKGAVDGAGSLVRTEATRKVNDEIAKHVGKKGMAALGLLSLATDTQNIQNFDLSKGDYVLMELERTTAGVSRIMILANEEKAAGILQEISHACGTTREMKHAMSEIQDAIDDLKEMRSKPWEGEVSSRHPRAGENLLSAEELKEFSRFQTLSPEEKAVYIEAMQSNSGRSSDTPSASSSFSNVNNQLAKPKSQMAMHTGTVFRASEDGDSPFSQGRALPVSFFDKPKDESPRLGWSLKSDSLVERQLLRSNQAQPQSLRVMRSTDSTYKGVTNISALSPAFKRAIIMSEVTYRVVADQGKSYMENGVSKKMTSMQSLQKHLGNLTSRCKTDESRRLVEPLVNAEIVLSNWDYHVIKYRAEGRTVGHCSLHGTEVLKPRDWHQNVGAPIGQKRGLRLVEDVKRIVNADPSYDEIFIGGHSMGGQQAAVAVEGLRGAIRCPIKGFSINPGSYDPLPRGDGVSVLRVVDDVIGREYKFKDLVGTVFSPHPDDILVIPSLASYQELKLDQLTDQHKILPIALDIFSWAEGSNIDDYLQRKHEEAQRKFEDALLSECL